MVDLELTKQWIKGPFQGYGNISKLVEPIEHWECCIMAALDYLTGKSGDLCWKNSVAQWQAGAGQRYSTQHPKAPQPTERDVY